GINDAGQIVGVYFDTSNNEHSFLYSAGTFTTLAEPSGTTIAFGINDAGQIVGEYEDVTGNAHGFLYSGGTFTNFDFPSATETLAWGINDASQVTGGYFVAGSIHGFLATLGPNAPPPGGTTADMILRASRAVSQYEIYDIGSNSILAAYSLGQIGNDWTFVG